MRNKFIEVFDTTLRDGEQAPDNTMSAEQKLEIAKALEALGVDIIEAGFPRSSAEELRAFKMISKEIKKSYVCALARCKKEDIDSAREALKGAKNPMLHLFFPSSEIQLRAKFGIGIEEAKKVVEENVNYASQFFRNIMFSAEDATRSKIEDIISLFESAAKFDSVVLLNVPDTTGNVQPKEMFDLVKKIKLRFPNKRISVHCHNDLGQAVANTLAAVSAGADNIQVTVNGFGERAGNAALEEVMLALETRKDFYKKQHKINLNKIFEVSDLVYKTVGRKAAHEKAIVGVNAFRHEAGVHVSAILKDSKSYEIIDPSIISRKRELVKGRHFGKMSKLDEVKK